MSNNSQATIVLVTGGTGYIGSQLIRDLADDPHFAGATIRILDNMQRENYHALMDLPAAGRYQFVQGDILDPATVQRALENVDIVIHLAAVAKTPLSFDHPTWTEQVNNWGTARLVEQCLDAGAARFIFASSASVYGPNGSFDEESPCRPIGPYAESKRKAEEAVLTAIDRGLEPTIVRLGTAFGYAPAIRFEAAPNRLAYLAGVGRPLTVYGTGEQVRPIIHVHDASAALRYVATKEKTMGQVLNAVGDNAAVLDLVDAVRASRPGIRVRYTEQDVLTHFSFDVDSGKLRSLGWEPQHDLEAGLGEVIDRFQHITSVPMAGLPLNNDSLNGN